MDDVQRIAVFRAQTTNVRELECAWRHVNRQINHLILSKDEKGVEINTKILALLYCSLAESIFSKLIHTPVCISLSDIERIKRTSSSSGIKYGWLICAQIATSKIGGAKTNHRHNVRKKLRELIEKYIFDPSLIRNKLAHGQWLIALNRGNTAVNVDLTEELSFLNCVELYRRKVSLEKLSAIIEDIIESPQRAHHRDYWNHMAELEAAHSRMADWSMRKKIDDLVAKKSHTRAISH